MFEFEWRKLKEFPNYELRADGIIRNINTKRQIMPYLSRNLEVVRLSKHNVRYLRSLNKLIRITYPEL